MIRRSKINEIEELIGSLPAVALLGARQVGKTTLASEIGKTRPSLYLDLESETDRARLQNAELYLGEQAEKLVILDEIQRMPSLFESLRGLIDRGIRSGRKTGQFLILGSASIDLLKQSSESLAGRIAFTELAPFHVGEIASSSMDQLWLRGGFPVSFLAKSNSLSLRWRRDFIRTYLERDIPILGPRIAAETLRRFWTMLAHAQSGLFNASDLARSLAIDGKTVSKYLDLMVDLLLVRRLRPYRANVGKRLVKAPKVYIRDSGLLHALLGIVDKETLLGHPVLGASWEGFVLENALNQAPEEWEVYFYRTAAGAEIDLLLQLPDQTLWAIEIKYSGAPKLSKGYHIACEDLKPVRRYVIYPGSERFPIDSSTEAISIQELGGILGSQ
ncbi:MAG: ATP-binding protein [Gemmatimonadetes bacterium]|nr:ATP-binding protein [Gemmatimonadota bacterium]